LKAFDSILSAGMGRYSEAVGKNRTKENQTKVWRNRKNLRWGRMVGCREKDSGHSQKGIFGGGFAGELTNALSHRLEKGDPRGEEEGGKRECLPISLPRLVQMTESGQIEGPTLGGEGGKKNKRGNKHARKQ